MKRSQHYSGPKSTRFWERVDALPQPARDTLYYSGVLLQDMESRVLVWLENAEAENADRAKGLR